VICKRLGISSCPADRLRARRPNHVWGLDFQFDQTSDGRILKLLNIVDEHSREELGGLAERRIDAVSPRLFMVSTHAPAVGLG
jgi:hypothetical protein